MEDSELLKDLNKEQREAVTHGEGPLMIIAGAGTGKTTVITKRIAWLIESKKAECGEILALTFTEKASSEMEERVDKLLPIGYLDLNISTFHAFCEKVLRTHGVHIGISDDFTLFTEVDSWLLMRRNLARFKLEYFRPKGNPTKFLKLMLQHFSRAKDEGVTPEEYFTFVENLVTEKSGGAPEAFAALADEDKLELQKWQELSGAYALYEKLLHENGAIDFGGLLLYVLRLFIERPNILKEYRERFKYVVVDEFQDTNSIQYKIVKLLADPKRNITVVGDDDQAIYKFRGAALANIMQFRTDYPEATRVVLTSNYRSGKKILDTAYKLIQENNPHRLEASEGLSKVLQSHKEEDGFVHHIHAAALDDEVDAVVGEILKKKEAGAEWSDFAILSRSNDAADPFLEALERNGIPYQFVALSGLYTKPVILDALAYLRAVNEPYNNTAFYRVLSHERLGLSEADLSELMLYVRRKGVSIADAMHSLSSTFGVSMEGRNRMHELLMTVEALRNLAKRLPVTELYVEVLKRTGLLGDIKMLTEAEQAETFRYLEGFLSRLKRFVVANPGEKTLRGFLEEFEAEREAGEGGGLKGDPEEGPDVVHVMTVHAAKGIEFRYVFVVNLIEQRFPSVTRTESLPLPPGLVPSIPELDDHVAEERRLFYVAMTRAKEGLYLLSAEDYGGSRKRKPSRFLKEAGFEPTSRYEGVRSLIPDEKEKAKKGEEALYPLPKRLSFSQIAAYTSCPLQYKYAHILKVPTFGRHTLSFGRSMHTTLEKFVKQLQDRQVATQVSLFGSEAKEETKIPALKEIVDLYEQSFIDEWYPSVEMRDEYKAKGLEAVKEFHRQMSENTPTPYLLEAGFTCKIKDILLKGRIDRIDKVEGGYEIIDYKTGNPKKTLAFEDKRQLLLYVIAAEECFSPPLKIQRVSYYYVESNEKISFEPSPKDIEKLKEQIVGTVEKIKTRDFTPEPGPFTCKYCDFKEICPFAEL
jgi:DNA helicase-2/ATP-dependent DNA helicase PcrA